MYDKILCIFPIDPTTGFLAPITELLKKHFGDIFELYRIDSTEVSYLKAIYKIEKCSNKSVIIFIGHGSSAGFHCLNETQDDTVIFLNSQNIERIRDKNIFAFSCNSSSFLKLHSEKLNSWLGFDDLPTEKETFPIRDSENQIFLEVYKEILIRVVYLSLIELITEKSFSKSYSILKLALNKEMIRLSKDKSHVNNKLLAEILYKTKKGIKYKD
jgi:hypothetical protein